VQVDQVLALAAMVKVAAAGHLEVVVEADHLMDQDLAVEMEAVDQLVQVRAHLGEVEMGQGPAAQGLVAEAVDHSEEVALVPLHHRPAVKVEALAVRDRAVDRLAVEVVDRLQALRHRPADKEEAALDRLADRVDQVQVVEVDHLEEAVARYPSEALFQSEVVALGPVDQEAVVAAAALLALEADRLALAAVALDQELSIRAVLELNWTLTAIVLELVTMLLCSVATPRSKFWSRPTDPSTVASTLSAAVKLATLTYRTATLSDLTCP